MFKPISFPPSTNVVGVEYDVDNQTLVVTFLSGRVYAYDQVDELTANGFEKAPSAAHYLDDFIKPLYAARRLA